MARNDSLATQFIRDIQQGRYPLIVSAHLNPIIKMSATDPFAIENNIWIPLSNEMLDYYKPIFSLKDVGLEAFQLINKYYHFQFSN